MPFSIKLQELMNRKMPAFLRFALRRLNEERVPQVAASLTFTTLLALVPVLTVTVALVSVFPVFDEWSGTFMEFINRNIVPQGADMVFDYISRFKEKASKLTAIGSLMLIVTSLMLIQTIDSAFNRIWRVNSRRPFFMQMLVYWAILTVGPLLLGIGVSLIFGALGQNGLEHYVPQLAKALRAATGISFSTFLLWSLYRFAPNRYVPGKHALAGAFFTAVCLETARTLFAWYMSNFDGYTSIYGAFAAVPFFLMWLNLLWMFVLAGAVLTSSLSYWRGEAFRRQFSTHGRFDDVLKILLLLEAAQQNGEAMQVQELRRHINMGFDELGELLEKLARYGYVYSGRQGWVLKMSSDAIALDELFKLFVYSPAVVGKDRVNNAVDAIMRPSLETLDITLAQFRVHTQKHGGEKQVGNESAV